MPEPSAPTPQPWTLTRDGDLLGPDGEKLLLSGVQLCINGTPAEKAEARANTRLLYLAPDLLAALEALLALWSRPLAADAEIDTAIDGARAAVARAKGGTP